MQTQCFPKLSQGPGEDPHSRDERQRSAGGKQAAAKGERRVTLTDCLLQSTRDTAEEMALWVYLDDDEKIFEMIFRRKKTKKKLAYRCSNTNAIRGFCL